MTTPRRGPQVAIVGRTKLRRGWLLTLACAAGHFRCVDDERDAKRLRVGCPRCAGIPHPASREDGMPAGRAVRAARRFVERTRRIGFELHMLEVAEGRRFAP